MGEIYIRKKQRGKYRINTDENNRHNKSLSERSNFEKKYKFKGLYKSKNEEDNSLINGEENDKTFNKEKNKEDINNNYKTIDNPDIRKIYKERK